MDQAMAGEGAHIPLIAGSAEASSVQTAAAIDEAAEKNEDPEVAEMLEDAALAAQQTVSRGTLDRLCGRPAYGGRLEPAYLGGVTASEGKRRRSRSRVSPTGSARC